MSRIRTIKPEFWDDEKIGALSPFARLLLLGIISLADDEGRFRATPAVLKAAAFKYDDVSFTQVEAWFGDLVSGDFVLTYVVDGQRYASVRNWLKHQKISHPTPSRLPAPPGNPKPRKRRNSSAVGELNSGVSRELSGAAPEPLRTSPESFRPDLDQGSGIKDQDPPKAPPAGERARKSRRTGRSLDAADVRSIALDTLDPGNGWVLLEVARLRSRFNRGRFSTNELEDYAGALRSFDAQDVQASVSAAILDEGSDYMPSLAAIERRARSAERLRARCFTPPPPPEREERPIIFQVARELRAAGRPLSELESELARRAEAKEQTV